MLQITEEARRQLLLVLTRRKNMKLYKKHPKPLQQDSSSKLVQCLERVSILDKPIADIACGYGRNGRILLSVIIR